MDEILSRNHELIVRLVINTHSIDHELISVLHRRNIASIVLGLFNLEYVIFHMEEETNGSLIRLVPTSKYQNSVLFDLLQTNIAHG